MSNARRALYNGFLAFTLTVSGAVGLSGCVRSDIAGPPEKKSRSPGVVSLQAAGTAPADGATQVRLVAVLDTAVAHEQRSVTFRTSAGAFPGGGREVVVAADSALTAVAVLIAPADTMTAVITATAGGGTMRTEVRFVRAPADLISVTTDQVALQSGFTSSVQVTATLHRDPGIPTRGQIVSFHAHAPGETRQQGRFSSDSGLSDGTGRVAVRFTPADSVFAGPVVIVARVAGRDGELRDSTIVQVVRPQ